MARGFICFLLTLSLICEVLSIYMQPAIQQYVHYTRQPQSHTIAIPTHNTAINQGTTINNAATNYASPTTNCGNTNPPRPTTGLPSLSALGLPNLVAGLQLPEQPIPTATQVATSSNIDAKLLNNLAVALQLLIVSNILNAPPPDTINKPELKETRVYSESTQQSPCFSQYETVMPNSNYIGTSNYAEPNLAQTYNPTRNGLSLMSPYDALKPIPSYTESIVSQYSAPNPRKDFKSPYSMIDSDLFSMNDLF